jgi:purine nucleosidase
MKRLVLAVTLALLAPLAARAAPPAPPEVIVDHDGAIDDLVAMSLLMKSGKVHVRAVTLTPADSYLEPATRATQLFVDRLGGRGVSIAKGHDEGPNPFPADWRKDAARVLDVDALKGVRPQTLNPVADEDAAHHLAGLLSGPKSYVIVATGPLTNIADALRLEPGIRRHIRRIYVMGGALHVPGNVSQPGHDGSAEWNIYNNPKAAADVLASGVPITLVPLDATNKAPLTRAFVDRLAQRAALAAQLTSQAWRLALGWLGVDDSYYFWDSLTAAALLDPSLVTVTTLKVKVISAGPSQGRTVEAADGTPIQVAVDADGKRLEALMLDVLGR